MPITTVKRSVSLPTELDQRLSEERNASGLITDLLTDHFDRADRIAEEKDQGIITVPVDGRVYKFPGTELYQDNVGVYFKHADGDLVFYNDHSQSVEKIEGSEFAINDYFGDNLPDEVAEAFGIAQVVWL